ncbi:MAG: hypothetical protein J0J10_02975 [Bosea sp.]|uniref:hypothetical protein n=1 Tax=Bosea sp. (in: a-proteobacteria) TaxID=1871050 RepID=UPI001AC58BEE|nr:hypothetical protein [Bosea sp. (in: a-proteobacteria)]MBN9467715.1 hypothetical protein [Bosea sp. (in: a-proteobacteria)]
MRAFKHWDDGRWANELTREGKIRLMPISYYWEVENVAPGVQDELEGSTRGTHGPMSWTSGPSLSQLAILKRAGVVEVDQAENISLGEVTLVRRGPQFYIFCMSAAADMGIFDNTVDVTTIPDVKALGMAIGQASGGRFDAFDCDVVTYRDVEFQFETADLFPDPFVKRQTFAHQREIRLVFKPAVELQGPQYIQSPTIVAALRPILVPCGILT